MTGKKCPFCNELNEKDNEICVYCGNKLDFDSNEAYCLNCGKPVEEDQKKCECGYEFIDMKCPDCGTYNSYTYNYCTSCGKAIRHPDVTFAQKVMPHGCIYNQDNLFIDEDFLKKELKKIPHQINGNIDTQTLHAEYLKHDRIIDEICSRWLIVSPNNCISCLSKTDALNENCPKCGITHRIDAFDNIIKELKRNENNYVKSNKRAELSRLKWKYKLGETELNDYLNSLAPKIGESQMEYRQRLFKEYWENCVISYIIESEWNMFFENICRNCGGEFEAYNLNCPSCGIKKHVTALSILFNNEYVETERFPRQYDEFSDQVENICRDNGGDVSYSNYGIVGCPECSNYFHYMTPDFISSHRCPHCGVHFEINAAIYEDEWDLEGLSYEEYMEQFYGVSRK